MCRRTITACLEAPVSAEGNRSVAGVSESNDVSLFFGPPPELGWTPRSSATLSSPTSTGSLSRWLPELSVGNCAGAGRVGKGGWGGVRGGAFFSSLQFNCHKAGND